jgi:biopolymer transport protein ExbB/TolQ
MSVDTIILFVLNIYFLLTIFSVLILFFSKKKINKDFSNNIKTYYLKALGFLNIFYMTSPFLGLIGTIYRIIEVFKDKNLFQNTDDAFGIIVFNLGEALEMTIYGISMALISLVFYIYYKNELKIIWVKNELI